VTDSFRTERLILRRWREDDVVPFAAINADVEVMRYFPSTLSFDESASMIERIESHFEVHGFGLWAVEIDGRLAGFTGLNTTTFDTPMGPHVEIGWRLATWARGKGVASEAAQEALRIGFDTGLMTIYSFTTETNVRSENVMKRIGMSRRPEFDFDHPRTPEWWGRRHIVYSIERTGGRITRNT
jgi:RimJ/RimL family protein N-acetyltransferase